MRDHPVAGLQHLARNLRVAPFVGVEQRPARAARRTRRGSAARRAPRRATPRRHVRRSSLKRARTSACTASSPERPALSAISTRMTGIGSRSACAWIVAMRTTGAPASRQCPSSARTGRAAHALELGVQREHLQVAAHPAPASVARRHRRRCSHRCPRHPSSSSKVGSVVGSCGQDCAGAQRPERACGRACRWRTARPYSLLERERRIIDLPAGRGMRTAARSRTRARRPPGRVRTRGGSSRHRRARRRPASARDRRCASPTSKPASRDAAHRRPRR